MAWNALVFLTEPAFVIPWYVLGLVGAFLVSADIRATATPTKHAMRLAWPIIVFFFSVLGLVMYAVFGRTRHQRAEPGISFRNLNTSVIHCVAGDGIGIITAMVFARAFSMTFWGEFWLEYATGFLVGWLVFQRLSMKDKGCRHR